MNRLALALSCIFSVRGGIPRFNQMLCLALDQLAPELDLEVAVISQDDTQGDYRAHGAPWKHVEFVPGGGKYGVLRRTPMLCAHRRPELLLLGLLGMTPAGVLSRPFLRKGFGFIAHGFECWSDHPLCDHRWSRLAAARRSRFAIAVSDYTRRELAALTGMAPESILLLPNTLEPSFEAFEEPATAGPDTVELLTVSRLWPEEKMKGVDTTLRAFAAVADRYPKARYRIVGKGGDKPRLQELARSLCIEERVRFEQDLSDERLADHYRRCAAFVLPSGQEGFGIVFLEAMRFSKPCVGGAHGGTPEVIEQGKTGYLVPFGDVQALARALERLLGDPALRHRMGVAGRRRLLNEFTFERFRERLRAHLRGLLGP